MAVYSFLLNTEVWWDCCVVINSGAQIMLEGSLLMLLFCHIGHSHRSQDDIEAELNWSGCWTLDFKIRRPAINHCALYKNSSWQIFNVFLFFKKDHYENLTNNFSTQFLCTRLMILNYWCNLRDPVLELWFVLLERHLGGQVGNIFPT